MADLIYYPSLNELIPLDKIPEEWSSLQEDLESVLRKIFYTDYYHGVSIKGDEHLYVITLVLPGKTELKVPGIEDLVLIVNPGYTDGTTIIPLQLEFSLGILRFINNVKQLPTNPNARDIFDLLLSLFNIDSSELIEEVLSIVYRFETDPYQAFLDSYNQEYNESMVYTDDISQIISNIKTDGHNVFDVIFTLITDLNLNIDEIVEQLQDVFFKWTGPITLDSLIKDLFIPKINFFTSNINLSLEFPRSILIPVETDENLDPNTDEGKLLPTPFKSSLEIVVDKMGYSTENGFFVSNPLFTKFSKSSILNTGFTLEITNASLDFSSDSNIPEADADGRPLSFKGLYAESIVIGLPAFWTKANNAEIEAQNMLLGTPLGITTNLRLNNGPLEVGIDDAFEISINTFEMDLKHNSVTNFMFLGDLTIAGVGSPMGISMTYVQSTGIYDALLSNIPAISIAGLTLDLDDFSFSFTQDGLQAFGTTATLAIANLTPVTSPINLAVSWDGSNKIYSIAASNLGTFAGLNLAIFKITFDDLSFSLQKGNGIVGFSGSGKLYIPFLKDANEVGIATMTYSIVKPVGGGFKLDLATEGGLKLGKAIVDISAFQMNFDDNGALGDFNANASITIPGIKEDGSNNDKVISLGFKKVGSAYTLEAAASFTAKIGSLALSFNSFKIAFDQNGIISTDIKGTLDADAFDSPVQFELLFSETGFTIAVLQEPNGFSFDIASLLTLTLYQLRFGKENDDIFFQIGDYDPPSNSGPGLKIETTGGSSSIIGKLLPELIDINSLRISNGSPSISETDVEVKWSSADSLKQGLSSGGITLSRRINKSLGPITLDTVELFIGEEGGKIIGQVDVDGSIKIGPIVGAVSGAGLYGTFEFDDNGNGNLGYLNIEDFGIKSPDGIGISVDIAAVKGGGFLSIDNVNKRYTGALSLTIMDKIEVNAFGVILTRLPDGSEGFSLIALITAEFAPAIPLGFGFTLNGVGGLLGLHRTTNRDYLRDGLKDGSIGNMLFPVNPQDRFMQIISGLESAFPVYQDRFVFGPALKIGWGSPTSLITVSMALLVELPAPVKFYILGAIRVLLPSEEQAILKLNIDFLGVIDISRKFISFDASIYDSKLLAFQLDGTMAFRLLGGDNPYFLISVGGFHPNFTVPTNLELPQQRRMSISLLNSSLISLSAKTYMAVTSNSVQFGVSVDLRGSIAVFSIEGYFAFDVLIIFNPFRFTVSVAAGLSVKGRLFPTVKVKIGFFKFKVKVELKEISLANIHFSGTLQGPSEWHVNGKATFRVLGIGYSFDVSKSWGSRDPSIERKIELAPRLIEELNKPINWDVDAGESKDDLVVLREFDKESLVLNGSGFLMIKQDLLPLKTNINKFGNGVPKEGTAKYSIKYLKFGTGSNQITAKLTDNRDYFARGEFQKLSKGEKLSKPSFEKMPNGIKASPQNANGALDFGNHSITRTYNYENKYINKLPADTNNDPIIGLNGQLQLAQQALDFSSAAEIKGASFMRKGNAAARHSRKQNWTRFTKSDKKITINEERYAIVNCDTLADHISVGTSVWATRAEAEDIFDDLLNQTPALKNQLLIIPEYEKAA